MTVKEARDYFNNLDLRHDEDCLVIPTQGLSCSRIEVKSLSQGFDWFNGYICINGETKPSQVDIKHYSKICKLYLMEKKVSNLKDIEDGKTLSARYKRLNFTAQRKSEAVLWIWEQLNKELKES